MTSDINVTQQIFDKHKSWLTSAEAATYLSISVANLRQKIRRGQVTAYKFGRRIRIRREDLDQLLESYLIIPRKESWR